MRRRRQARHLPKDRDHPCEEGCDLAEQGAEQARQGAARRARLGDAGRAGMAHLPNLEATSRSGGDPGLRSPGARYRTRGTQSHG